MQHTHVAIVRGDARYSGRAQIGSDGASPESLVRDEAHLADDPVHESVRTSLRLLGLDEDKFGTPAWNPLGELIAPGDRVVLKPNLIRESHPERTGEWEQVITHPSIIRAVLDYVYIALRGRGRVTIADGPQTDSDFEEIVRRTHLDEIVRFFRERGLEISLLDLRRERWLQRSGVTYKRQSLPGDPLGYVDVNLDGASEFGDYALSGRFYGADYDIQETARYHANGRHAYVLCRTVMEADVVINLPKMKTHKKTGVTLSLKNLVGTNGCRNCLPHHTLGTPAERGDEYPTSDIRKAVQSRGIVAFKKWLTACGGCGGPLSRAILAVGKAVFGDTNSVVRSGNWYGNDTAWRMVLDLNKCLFWYDGTGQRRKKPPKYLTLVDGIVAGEGDGPVTVDAKPCGILVAGFNPVAVDTVCATLMGFDFKRLRMLERAWRITDHPLVGFSEADVVCASNFQEWNGTFRQLEAAAHLGFRPHFGWIGHVERRKG